MIPSSLAFLILPHSILLSKNRCRDIRVPLTVYTYPPRNKPSQSGTNHPGELIPPLSHTPGALTEIPALELRTDTLHDPHVDLLSCLYIRV